MQSTLQAANLSIGFGENTIAKDISLTLNTSEITVIAGANGAGKSTLLKALARQLTPQSGQILLDGRDAWQLSASEFARAVAFVPQSTEMESDLTVEEMVMLGRYPHQKWWQWRGSEADHKAIEDALDRCELTGKRKCCLSELSGGEAQRAALATALAQEPRFMILDEPTSHLDFRHQLEVVSILKDLKERGLSIVLVLHDLNIMAKLADRVVLLKRSESAPSVVAAVGSQVEVLTEENLRSTFNVNVRIIHDADTGERLYKL